MIKQVFEPTLPYGVEGANVNLYGKVIIEDIDTFKKSLLENYDIFEKVNSKKDTLPYYNQTVADIIKYILEEVETEFSKTEEFK